MPYPAVKEVDTLIDDLFVRHVARGNRDVCELVDGLALGDKTPDCRGRICGLQQRPIGAAPDPAQDHLGIRLEPDGDRPLADTRARLLAQHGAAAGREHNRRSTQQPRDHPRLAVAEMRLAVGFENFGNRHSGGEFNLGVGVDEGHRKARCETPPDGGLAGPHHADEHQRASTEPRDDRGLRGADIGR